ncbi:hypothetical protein D3C78_894480 [compost metagenome]
MKFIHTYNIRKIRAITGAVIVRVTNHLMREQPILCRNRLAVMPVYVIANRKCKRSTVLRYLVGRRAVICVCIAFVPCKQWLIKPAKHLRIRIARIEIKIERSFKRSIRHQAKGDRASLHWLSLIFLHIVKISN